MLILLYHNKKTYRLILPVTIRKRRHPMKRKSFIAAIAAMSMFTTGILSGCGEKKDEVKTSASPTDAKYGDTYPIESSTTLTYWVEFPNQSTAGVTNFADLPFYKAVKEKTGIDVKFTHPSSGEQNNMMLASGEYPDIMEIDFYNYPGGPSKAIEEEYIIPLNDYLQFAPNFCKYLEEHPDVDKMCKTDDGIYYSFPFIRGDKSLIVFCGLMLRQDWLDELNLEVPTTIDEWHTVLTAFKEQKGVAAPLSFLTSSLKSSAAFSGAYGVRSGLYIDNGKVKYGEAEPGYKEFIKTMHQWYEEGLIDKNVATLDSKILDSNVLDGKTGAMIGNVGGGIGKWTSAMKSVDPNFKLVAAPYPSLKKGERVRFGQFDNMVQAAGSASISSSCKDVELAMRYLDYAYSEEGHMLFNFGEEGVSYNMIDGYPTYTDIITNNPDGKSFTDALYIYARPNGNGPFVQDPRYMEQSASLPEQKKALEVWSDNDADKTQLPRLLLTTEESDRIARIKSDLDTYTSESFMSFILGTMSIDDYDEYLNQLKSIGVDEYVQVYQEAYERYKTR